MRAGTVSVLNTFLVHGGIISPPLTASNNGPKSFGDVKVWQNPTEFERERSLWAGVDAHVPPSCRRVHRVHGRDEGGPGRGADRAAWPHHTVGRCVRTKTQLIFCVRTGALIGVRIARAEEMAHWTVTARSGSALVEQ